MTSPFVREDFLLEKRVRKAEKRKEVSICFIQELLTYHPEIPITESLEGKNLGWKIIASYAKDPDAVVLTHRGNCIAIMEPSYDPHINEVYYNSTVYDVSLKVTLRPLRFSREKDLAKLLEETTEFTSLHLEGNRLSQSEKIVTFGKTKHHIYLAVRGEFLNIIDTNLGTLEKRRYLFRIDKFPLDDIIHERYLESYINPKAAAEVKGQLYYFHDTGEKIILYHCQSGKKAFTLNITGLKRVMVRKDYVVLDCRERIISIKCEELE